MNATLRRRRRLREAAVCAVLAAWAGAPLLAAGWAALAVCDLRRPRR